MLNGVAPIIIFSFFKKQPATKEKGTPLISQVVSRFSFPPIPVYLDESLGVLVSSKKTNIDIATRVETMTNGDPAAVTQKGIAAITTIEMVANKNNLILGVILAMSTQILQKVTSKEYSISFLHESTVIVNGLLHSFNREETSDSEMTTITMEISQGGEDKSPLPKPGQATGTASLNDAGSIQSGSLPSAGGGSAGNFSIPGSVPVVTP